MELNRFIRPWRTWPAISEYMCRAACPTAVWSAHQRGSGSSTVVKAILLTSLQEAHKRQWHECDWMSHYSAWCGKSLRPYFIYKHLDKSLTYPIVAIGDKMSNLCFIKRSCLTLIKSNTTQQCDLMQIVSCIKQGGDKYSKALQKTHTDDWQYFKTEDVWWKNSTGITIVFIAKKQILTVVWAR